MTTFGLVTKRDVENLDRKIKILKEETGFDVLKELDRISTKFCNDPYYFSTHINRDLDNVLSRLSTV